jgi:hypothetical protein
VTPNYQLLDSIDTARTWGADEMWRRRVLGEGYDWYEAKAGWGCAEAVRVEKRRAADEFEARDRARVASTARRACFTALGSSAMPPVAVVEFPAASATYDFEKRAFLVLLSDHAPMTRRFVRYFTYDDSMPVPGALVHSFAVGIPEFVHFGSMLDELWRDQTASLWLGVTARGQFVVAPKASDLDWDAAFKNEPDTYLVVPWDEGGARELRRRLDKSLVVQVAFEPKTFDMVPVTYRGVALRGVGGIAVAYRLVTKTGPVTSWTPIRAGADDAPATPQVASGSPPSPTFGVSASGGR